ncbi:hypothetical protein ACIHFE_04525 [Streptomyces sp. NPDC052396]|uniref:hypothetical protein n=1 Tax=Streptomyces sp. NPDC052396 TaxID=3365689 RepID=UPI0037D1BC49
MASTSTSDPLMYATYAPKGETCEKCRKPIRTDKPCRRVDNERSSASLVARYWHTECVTGGAK